MATGIEEIISLKQIIETLKNENQNLQKDLKLANDKIGFLENKVEQLIATELLKKRENELARIKQWEEHTRNDPIEQFYTIGDVLGRGGFSVVNLCTDKKSNKEYAAKFTSKNADTRSALFIDIEMKVLQTVCHPNLVQLQDLFETNEHFIFIMEKISGGELFDKIVELNFYSEHDASLAIAQVLKGVAHMHEMRIVHRDLKPENLLLSSKNIHCDIKITDFGLSSVFQTGQEMVMTDAVGTPSYIAPEVLDMLDGGPAYGKEIDLWAVGVILYILLCGYPPFYGNDDEEIYCAIQKGDFTFHSPAWDEISDTAKDIIRGLLNRHPKRRFTAIQALAHPWIVSYNEVEAKPLRSTIEELKKFNAKRKFKGAINAVKALNRLRKATGGILAQLRSKK
eukprot:TRINITY_DN8169_c0_g1_i1.p1 TRINITY_DN8169_c0_g1~~TRINITY_DN8169_c0_g1_i1.p1  ORF type:complete len:396 (+),score=201.32 TRINITY_DN8169_c0_g1_i1:69-1256(+)